MRKVTALLGPRRYGKTSVLRRVAADLVPSGVSLVWLDLYELTSMVDLALRLDDAIHRARGPVAASAARTAAAIGLTLGVIRVEFTKPARPDSTATVHVLLDTLVRAATGTPTLLVVDEFAGIARVNGAAGLLRTKLQHHYQSLGLLFAGSEPSTMQALFSEREQPFYAQADVVTIGPLDAVAVHDLVTGGFTATGRDPGPLPRLIHGFCGGHPRRTMQLADQAWERAAVGDPWTIASGGSPTPGTWSRTRDHAGSSTLCSPTGSGAVCRSSPPSGWAPRSARGPTSGRPPTRGASSAAGGTAR